MNYTGGEHGIMAAIMAMTAPPGNSDSNNKSKQEKSGGQKKNNRAAKESFCEGCGDPGEVLLSCTGCSVCYHPVCDEPPLDEELMKDIEWKCRSCRNKSNEVGKKDTEKVETQAKSSKQETELDYEPINEDTEPLPEHMDEAEPRKPEPESPQSSDVAQKIGNIFNKVVSNAKGINPTPFEIPRSFHLNKYQFPGTSRSQIRKAGGGGKLKPTIVDLENFKVPTPVSVCFNCSISCRIAPLLQCDYCPKQYHFDCLNPPLTSPPVGLWICPLHPEPFLESKQLKSWQLSERVKIWDMTHKQIDRSNVILKFVSKCSRKNPPFSSKVPITVAIPYDVPEGSGNHPVKQGANKTSDELDPEAASRKRKLFKCYENLDLDAPEETDDLLNLGIPTISKVWRIPLLDKISEEIKQLENAGDDTVGKDIEDIEKNKTAGKEVEIQAAEKMETVDDEIGVTESIKQAETVGDETENQDMESTTSETAKITSSVTTDESKAQSCDTQKECEGESGSGEKTGIDFLLEASTIINHKEDRRMTLLKTLPLEHVYELAAQRLEDVDLIWKGMAQPISRPIETPTAQPVKKFSTAPQSKPIAKHTIQFYCLNTSKSVKFSTQSIVIGTSNTVEPGSSSFNPEIFVKCKRLSGLHAVIFYDRSHLQWEIINYSPYGLIIDSVLHTLKPIIEKQDHPQDDIEAIKSQINKRRGILIEKLKNPRIQSNETAKENDCPCQAENSFIIKVKHEGGASICVGSEIQIGCLKLVVKSLLTEEIPPLAGPTTYKRKNK